MFHAPPDLGGGLGGGASSLGPPRKNSWGASPPKRVDALTSCSGQTGNFAPKTGQKWPNFPARATGARGIPQRVYSLVLQIGSNLRSGLRLKNAEIWFRSVTWWRNRVHIASKTVKTTPNYVKTALRAPKVRAKNFSQNLAPPEFLSGGGAPPSLARPLHETLFTVNGLRFTVYGLQSGLQFTVWFTEWFTVYGLLFTVTVYSLVYRVVYGLRFTVWFTEWFTGLRFTVWFTVYSLVCRVVYGLRFTVHGFQSGLQFTVWFTERFTVYSLVYRVVYGLQSGLQFTVWFTEWFTVWGLRFTVYSLVFV